MSKDPAIFAEWGLGIGKDVISPPPAREGALLRVLVVAMDAVSIGGSSVRVRAVLRHLLARGHQLTLLTGTALPPEDELALSCRTVSICFRRSRWRGLRAVERLVCLPEPAVRWVRQAAATLPRVIGQVSPDVVLISSPPHAIQRLGSMILTSWKIPYVADLRDDWVGSHRARWLTPIHRRAARRAEVSMVQDASYILANTPLMRQQFLSRHPMAAQKVVTVSNGYNDHEFSGGSPGPRRGNRVRVGYVGSDYDGFVPRLLANVARHWLRRGEDDQWQLAVCSAVTARPTSLPAALWDAQPLVPPAESVAVMESCDVLLAVMPPGEREPSPTVPLKVYSYLRTGLPIVYCGERGAATELLGYFEGTFCLRRNTGQHLAQFLSEHRAEWGKRHARRGLDFFSYERVSLRVEALLRRAADIGCQLLTDRTRPVAGGVPDGR
jgi:hypothetical protein